MTPPADRGALGRSRTSESLDSARIMALPGCSRRRTQACPAQRRYADPLPLTELPQFRSAARYLPGCAIRSRFDRFLARLVAVASDRWVLKGALALDFRLGSGTRRRRTGGSSRTGRGRPPPVGTREVVAVQERDEVVDQLVNQLRRRRDEFGAGRAEAADADPVLLDAHDPSEVAVACPGGVRWSSIRSSQV